MNRIALRVLAAVLGGLLLGAAGLTHADAELLAERCSRTVAGADGIGKRYMGREIAGVMGWRGAAWLEREAAVHGLVWERTAGTLPWQHPVVFLKPG